VIGAMLARLLRHHRGLFLAMALGIVLMEALLVWVASHIETGPGFMALMEQALPPAMRQMILSQFAVAGFSGMIGFGFQHPLVLVAAIAWVIVVGTVPAAERETGLLDLILARPVPRGRYLAAVTAIMALGAVILPTAILVAVSTGLAFTDVAGELPWTRYLPSALGMVALLLAIGGYTLLFAAGARRRGTAVASAVGVTLALYWVDFMAGIWEPFEVIRWVSPFAYYRPVQAAVMSQASAVDSIVLLAVFVVASAGAFVRFQRQDL
jgi:ABC-2 type transport system permease protein